MKARAQQKSFLEKRQISSSFNSRPTITAGKKVWVFLALISLLGLSACGDEAEGYIDTVDTAPPPVDVAVPDVQEPPPQEPEPTSGCVAAEFTDLESCCEDTDSKCAPSNKVAPDLHMLFATCGDGGLCVPSDVFSGEYEWTASKCTSLGGVEGACVSRCSPKAQGLLEFLPQDVCDEATVCVPCVDPDDGSDTGVCQTFDCFGEPQEEPPAPADYDIPDPFSCDNMPTEPVVDMNQFEPCCEGAHCVPKTAIPPELVEELNPCADPSMVCVPDEFVETVGFFVPPTCALPGDLEGRCLSKCLPVVQDSIGLLPQSTCNDNQRCVPCCDPFTAEHTGACDIGCDAGVEDGFCDFGYDQCCDGSGHCLPSELIPPDMLGNLGRGGCSEGTVCTPDVLQDPAYQAPACTGQILFTVDYTGVCLSKCLKIPLDFLIWSGSCPSKYDCVPCVDPLTGESTGAPGCP